MNYTEVYGRKPVETTEKLSYLNQCPAEEIPEVLGNIAYILKNISK